MSCEIILRVFNYEIKFQGILPFLENPKLKFLVPTLKLFLSSPKPLNCSVPPLGGQGVGAKKLATKHPNDA